MARTPLCPVPPQGCGVGCSAEGGERDTFFASTHPPGRVLFGTFELDRHPHFAAHLSAQLESQHFFRIGDQVRSLDGRYGEVLEGFSLYASIRWDDGTMKEIDQFDPEVTVIERQQEG